MRIFISLVIYLALTGCASMTGSTLQKISVQALQEGKPLAAVVCSLSNSAGSWEVKAPGTAMVSRSASPLTVDCKRQGSVGRETLTSKHNTTILGNLLVGGGLGYFYDANTGAAFGYPDSVTVVMQSSVPDPARPKPWTRFPPLTQDPVVQKPVSPMPSSR